LHLPEGPQERRYVLCGDAAHELLSDGSYRRKSLLRGAATSRSWTFFHAGRVRTAQAVGGIGGRVESLQSEGSVLAPMNGQVVKLFKEVGDRIESGDIVLILEAMKMENEVTAPINGVLKELEVKPGQTVGPGDLLFCVEAAE
jgi:biotin carboxyl carrier protein